MLDFLSLNRLISAIKTSSAEISAANFVTLLKQVSQLYHFEYKTLKWVSLAFIELKKSKIKTKPNDFTTIHNLHRSNVAIVII